MPISLAPRRMERTKENQLIEAGKRVEHFERQQQPCGGHGVVADAISQSGPAIRSFGGDPQVKPTAMTEVIAVRLFTAQK